jgi:glycine oxidase
VSDFLIIGGGINGLLLARELSQAGAEVTLVEKGQCCREASWAGGGIVSPLYPWRYDKAVTALASWAQDFYPRLCAELADATGIDPQWQQCGLLMLQAEDADTALAWAARHGREMQAVTSDFIHTAEPELSAGFTNGLWMPAIANVRNPRLGQALVTSLAADPRVSMREQCQVAGLTRRQGRVVEVTALEAGRRINLQADEVVICAGAWSAELAAFAGFKLPVEPVKGQMLLYKPTRRLVNAIVLTAGRYVIPRVDGHLLVGSTLEYTGFDKSLTEGGRQTLQAAAISLLPALAALSPVGHWAGLRPGAPGGIPCIGRVPGFDNLHVNAGQFRNGLVLAPASARLMADLLLGRRPLVDPRPYRP